MYNIWVSLELASVLIAAISAWAAAGRLGKLRYGGSAERLHRKARTALVALAWMAVPWLSALYAITQLALQYDPVFWRDRLFLHAPPLVIAGFAVYALTVPAVWRLWRDTATTTGAPLPPELLRRTVHPVVTAPALSAAAAAALALYYLLVPPVPAKTAEIAIPLLLFGSALVAIVWTRAVRYRRVMAGQPSAFKLPPLGRRLLRKLGVLAVTGAVAFVFFSVAAANSRLPAGFSMMDGPMDFGGGTAAHTTHPATVDASPDAAHGSRASHAAEPAVAGMPPASGTDAVSVAELTGPRDEAPDRRITLTAMKQTVRLASGRTVEAWTFDGQIPGPEIRVRQGELVEVTLVNRDIEAGVTIHWHGIDVPNAEDGVAGVTQNAVMPGEKHVYRFRAGQAGSFWYHTHQQSREGVQRGLFGPLVVEPEGGAAEDVDLTVMPHIWPGAGTAVNRSDTLQRVKVEPGSRVRLRLYNTDDWTIRKYVLVGAPFRVSAIDGTDVNGARELRDTVVEVTSGARFDLTFTMPDEPVLLSVDRRRDLGLLFTPDGIGDAPALPRRLSRFDPLRYGEPAPVPFGADSRFDRSFTMLLDNKLGFFNGSFNQLYTINGEVFPRTPMFVVREGDLVKVTIINRGSVDHPMHLHGHHALVLSRNGEPASGSPWWTDTLDVRPGDVYELAFRADNPGLWMDHCHNLAHAAIGMTMHLMYEGVYTPYEAGAATGNLPE